MKKPVIFASIAILLMSQSFRIYHKTTSLCRKILKVRFMTSNSDSNAFSGDSFITGLNSARDISVKVVSCKEIIQASIIRNGLSHQAAKALSEVMLCSLMMGSGLKSGENLQVNIVGDSGIKNIMVITDGDLNVRGMVGDPNFNRESVVTTKDLVGNGQIQVVRTHPAWKSPMNGIVSLRDTTIATNLALYMAESDQRPSAIVTDVSIKGDKCLYALGIMVERLPGAKNVNIETSINNLQKVEAKGLHNYLYNTIDANGNTEQEQLTETLPAKCSLLRDSGPALNSILDDCLHNLMSESSSDSDSSLNTTTSQLRWTKTPRFVCTCGTNKIWRMLRLLPKHDIEDMVSKGDDVEVSI